MNDRGLKCVAFDRAGVGDLHVAHERQTIHLGLEGTQIVGERFRQHRNHATRKIDGGPSFTRVDVDRIAVANIMRDIGDCDDESKAVAVALAINRIVEVLGCFAVDRNQR